MSWIRRYIPVWQTRILLGLVFFGSLIVCLWPIRIGDIDVERLIACILAGIAWVLSELASAPRTPSRHDEQLFSQIRDVIDEDTLRFLCQHDFYMRTIEENTRPIKEISGWHGPRYEFLDPVIERAWRSLRIKIVELSELYGSTLVNTERDGILTAWHSGFSQRDQPDEAHNEIKQLNELSHAVYNEFNVFFRCAQRRLHM